MIELRARTVGGASGSAASGTALIDDRIAQGIASPDMPPTERTAVRVLCSSGEVRTIDGADSARLEDAFFLIMKGDARTNRIDVILTLRSQDVIGAEILTNGVQTAYVAGRGAVR